MSHRLPFVIRTVSGRLTIPRMRHEQTRTTLAVFLALALLGSTIPASAICDAARAARRPDAGWIGDNGRRDNSLARVNKSTRDALGDFGIAGSHRTASSVEGSLFRTASASTGLAEHAYSMQAGVFASASNHATLARSSRYVRFARNITSARTTALASPVAVQSGGSPGAIAAGAVVRHGPQINAGRVEGSVRQLLGETVTLNGPAVITLDLLVPGTPQVILNGGPSLGGTVDGTGSAQPSGYSVVLNGNAQLGRLVRRTDPITMPSVAAPPASTGTRNVVINNSSQSPGDFSTLRDLTLNGGVGMFAVPPGTYRNFIANGGAGFVLGTAGSTQAQVYNFAALTLNGQSSVQVVGPVVLTVGGSVTLNASMGSTNNPLWLTLKIASGGVTLNGGSFLSGVVVAPGGTVIINGNSTLKGTCFSDRLTVNGGGLLQGFGDTAPPIVNIDSPCQNAVTNLAQIGVSGSVSDSTPTTVSVNGIAATQNAGIFSATVPLAAW